MGTLAIILGVIVLGLLVQNWFLYQTNEELKKSNRIQQSQFNGAVKILNKTIEDDRATISMLQKLTNIKVK